VSDDYDACYVTLVGWFGYLARASERLRRLVEEDIRHTSWDLLEIESALLSEEVRRGFVEPGGK